MKKILVLLVCLSSTVAFAGQGGIYAGNSDSGFVVYDHEIDAGSVNFSWKLSDEKIFVKLRGTTKGWVAVGFNPENKMKGSNIIMGYVEDGTVRVSDQYGSKKRNHKEDVKAGGESNVADVTGNEKAGITEICFSFPVKTGDIYDKPIKLDENNVVMLAHGSGRDSFKGGHSFKTLYRVDLNNGKSEKIK